MKDYRGMPTVGYWSEMGLVEVKEIEYGIDDYALVTCGAMSGKPTSHRLKIYTTESDMYINFRGRRLKFSECIWVFKICCK